MTTQAKSEAVQIRYRTIALPVEHGGWGFLIEPILAGLLVAPSWAGLCLCVAALGAFLVHQPLKVALKDTRAGRRYARTGIAWRFVAVYATVAVVALLMAAWLARGLFWGPLLLVAPFALVQVAYNARNRGREWLPEAAGALSLGATAPAVLLAGGQSWTSALLLWVLLGLRSLPAILYVRILLRRQRRGGVAAWPALLAHLLALGVAAVLALTRAVVPLAVGVMLLLLARAVFMIVRRGPAISAPIIGISELGFGVLSAVLLAFAVR
jgi:hypothetical protein